MAFKMNPFIANPGICTPVYSCNMVSGPSLDLCAKADGTTQGVFSVITGNYEFYSTDMAKYPPGDYTFEITATLGSISKKITFVMTLVDPCPTTTLTINSPFVPKLYTLRDPQIDQSWNINSIVSKATAVDCGPLAVDFFNDDATESSLDTSIFADIRVNTGDFKFINLYTEDTSKKGTYPIKFRAYYTEYISNVVTLPNAFVTTIIDPCDKPTSVQSPSALTNQEYTITQNPVFYTVPVYTADPSWCAIRYTYTVTDSDGNVVNSITSDSLLSFDDLNRVFTIENKSNLDLSGSASKTYKIEVTGTAGNVIPTSSKASFDLTAKNPCINPAFVSISAPAFLND